MLIIQFGPIHPTLQNYCKSLVLQLTKVHQVLIQLHCQDQGHTQVQLIVQEKVHLSQNHSVGGVILIIPFAGQHIGFTIV